MKSVTKKVVGAYSAFCAKAYVVTKQNMTAIMFLFGIVLLTSGMYELSEAGNPGNNAGNATFKSFANPNFQDGAIRASVGNLFALIEGAFGALIMVVSGLGAIVAAAMGAYRAAVGMLVVAVGAFILRALVSLFFGDQFGGVGVGTSNDLQPQ